MHIVSSRTCAVPPHLVRGCLLMRFPPKTRMNPTAAPAMSKDISCTHELSEAVNVGVGSKPRVDMRSEVGLEIAPRQRCWCRAAPRATATATRSPSPAAAPAGAASAPRWGRRRRRRPCCLAGPPGPDPAARAADGPAGGAPAPIGAPAAARSRCPRASAR